MIYEKYGAHISHTNNLQATRFLQLHSEWVPYVHEVKSQTKIGLLSWPPQISELRQSGIWSKISKELESRPSKPKGNNFEEYCITLMGKTIYELFIRGYTVKQWGTNPINIAADFAPKRIDIRDDDYTPLFRDKFQGWPLNGWQYLLNSILNKSLGIDNLKMGMKCTDENVEWGSYDACLVTAPLDEFLGLEPLPWRGVQFTHNYFPKQKGVKQIAGVVNYPDEETPWTRTIETKWMSGQLSKNGTVVTYEYPGASSKHYPINDVAGKNFKRANLYKTILKNRRPNSYIAGRLANYCYIDTDQSITQGLNVSKKILKDLTK